ncbi:MAG: hypothetical protein JXM69_01610 [Anaerolineae bacterium]|nr:hypothetical protein [Anaerolineae bacterium]
MSQRVPLDTSTSQSLQDKSKYLEYLVFLPTSTRLLLLFVMALFLTLQLASGNVTAEMSFQSPQSPPPAEQPPVEQPPSEQPPAEQPPIEQPPAEQPPSEQPPAEQPPIEQPPVEQPPAEQPPIEQPPVEQPPAEQQPSGPAPAPLEPLPPLDTTDDENVGAGDVESPMVLDEAELIDTIIVSGAYVWLCCGVILLLLIPLALLILYIRGRGKIIEEEGF